MMENASRLSFPPIAAVGQAQSWWPEEDQTSWGQSQEEDQSYQWSNLFSVGKKKTKFIKMTEMNEALHEAMRRKPKCVEVANKFKALEDAELVNEDRVSNAAKTRTDTRDVKKHTREGACVNAFLVGVMGTPPDEEPSETSTYRRFGNRPQVRPCRGSHFDSSQCSSKCTISSWMESDDALDNNRCEPCETKERRLGETQQKHKKVKEDMPKKAADLATGSWVTRRQKTEVMLEAFEEKGKELVRKSKNEDDKKIQVLQKAKKDAGRIDACVEGDRGKWKCISIAVDSGACDNVIPPEELPSYENEITDTKASRDGDDFVSASGDLIPNYGELRLPVVTREMTTRGMVFQAAGVAKPLGSVKKMLQAGHRVVFDSEASFILNKATGETNVLREEDGNFMLDVWVPPPEVARAAGFTRQP